MPDPSRIVDLINQNNELKDQLSLKNRVIELRDQEISRLKKELEEVRMENAQLATKSQ